MGLECHGYGLGRLKKGSRDLGAWDGQGIAGIAASDSRQDGCYQEERKVGEDAIAWDREVRCRAG